MSSFKFWLRSLFLFLVLQYSLFSFYAPCGFTKQVSKREGEQTSEGLEMIAVRMHQLSQRLEQMPEPPALDQTLEIPDWNPKVSLQKGEPSSQPIGKDNPLSERKEK